MFVDQVTIELIAGKGGNGVVAWRREKYLPKGGPWGGNGGKGGSIILKADNQIPSLDWYRHRRKIKAENGQGGGANCRQGRSGENLILKVPLGTLVKDANTGEVLMDFSKPDMKWDICQGGRGGRGNASFKTSINRAPNFCTEGKPGQSIRVELELKIIADVGLVGFPNAGKSTLISQITDVHVKIAPYPFTTLRPNIGSLKLPDLGRILIADIPGIIENAYQNRGLGHEFLRHIERTKLLLFVLDASGIDGRTPLDDYRVLRNELSAYNPDLLDRPYFVLLNKIDTQESKKHIQAFQKAHPAPLDKLFTLSAMTGEGIDTFLSRLKEFFRENLEVSKKLEELQMQQELDEFEISHEQDELEVLDELETSEESASDEVE
ncbi:MAG: GTPase ObgE [Waddliaceae bacterium]